MITKQEFEMILDRLMMNRETIKERVVKLNEEDLRLTALIARVMEHIDSL